MLIPSDSFPRFCASLTVLALLSGCVDYGAPVAPDPAVSKLMASCNAGDMAACTAVADLNQRARLAVPPPVFQTTYIDPESFMNRRPTPQPIPIGPRATTCYNYGMVVPCPAY